MTELFKTNIPLTDDTDLSGTSWEVDHGGSSDYDALFKGN